MQKPEIRPNRPHFSSGPTAKRPEWELHESYSVIQGRSHRAKIVKKYISHLHSLQREILQIPDSWKVVLMPGSDTGAFEAALWSMLGARAVDVISWDSFGSLWGNDIIKHLKIQNTRSIIAEYGDIPDLSIINSDNDVVFTWNGTTSGVMVDNMDWISKNRAGLVFCDATSAVFAMKLDWSKLDVVSWSWQKCMGGEAQHGMLALSPKAIERLNSWIPNRPIPKVFRLSNNGQIMNKLLEEDTINTPSLLAVSDYIGSLEWAKSAGGLNALISKCKKSLDIISKWVETKDWVEFLCHKKEVRSWTSVCLVIKSEKNKSESEIVKSIVSNLEELNIAYDIGAHRDAPTGLRIWCGPTVEYSDVQKLLPWIDWAHEEAIK